MFTFLKPPLVDDIELNIRVSILNAYLWIAIGIIVFIYALHMVTQPHSMMRWLTLMLVGLSYNGIALVLLKTARFSAAAWTVVASLFIISVFVSYTGGGINQHGFANFLVATIIAGTIVSRRAGFLVAAFSMVCLVVLAGFQAQGLLPADMVKRTALGTLVSILLYVFEVAILVFLLTLYNRKTLRKALDENRERTAAEKALSVANAELRSILDSSVRVAITTTDMTGIIRSCNRGAELMLGYRPDELIGRMTPLVFHDPAEVAARRAELSRERGREIGEFETFVATVREGATDERVWTYVRRDGTRLSVNLAISPVCGPGGELVGFVGTATDITERLTMEEQVRTSLAEKEVLLRELYHRTKNNMQVICGMLSLESSRGPVELRSVFDQVNMKIRSMALVHQKLYESGDLTSVDVVEYARDLAQLVLGDSAGATGAVSATVTGEPVLVSIDAAVPLGLVLNELITNSVKHAFSGGANGTISMDIREGERVLTITYRDSGPGLPTGIETGRTTNLGMQILHEIVRRQLQGSLTMLEGPGFVCRLTVKLDLYVNRL